MRANPRLVVCALRRTNFTLPPGGSRVFERGGAVRQRSVRQNFVRQTFSIGSHAQLLPSPLEYSRLSPRRVKCQIDQWEVFDE